MDETVYFHCKSVNRYFDICCGVDIFVRHYKSYSHAIVKRIIALHLHLLLCSDELYIPEQEQPRN